MSHLLSIKRCSRGAAAVLLALLVAPSQLGCSWIWPRDDEAEHWPPCACTDGSPERKCVCRPGDSSLHDASRDAGIDITRDSSGSEGLPTCPNRGVDDGSTGCAGPETGTACWVALHGGEFQMGSPPTAACRESTDDEQHKVTLTHDFWMQSTEVTQAQFSRLMSYNPSACKACGSNCPVEMVTWDEAVAYCNALSREAGKPECYACSGDKRGVICQVKSTYGGKEIYNCPGYRLPTDAEWEYAYRAGTTAAYYPIGESDGSNNSTLCTTCSTVDANLNQIGWYCANAAVIYEGCASATDRGGSSCVGTHPVGQKRANAWGLRDMAGNVWEWCHAGSPAFVGSAPTTDPVGECSSSLSERNMRGGSYAQTSVYLRAASRASWPRSAIQPDLGFRCVRTTCRIVP